MKRRKLNKLVGSWRPWDYEYNLDVEKEMFRKQAEYFKSHNIAVGDSRRAEICQLLVNLLNIVDGTDDNLELIMPSEIKGTAVIWNSKWEFKNYINTKNSYRFLSDNFCNEQLKPVWLNELRQQKAWYLYNKIRYNQMQTLWN